MALLECWTTTSAISASTAATSKPAVCRACESTHSPSTSSSKMSMMVQKAASTTAHVRWLCINCWTTQGTPEIDAANQKLYLMSFGCPSTLLMICAANSRAPQLRSISRQESLASATLPNPSTIISARSVSFQASTCKSSNNPFTAIPNCGTCADSWNCASPRATVQMAAVNFRRHLTEGLGPSMSALSSNKARNTSGNFLIS
mmetsp:Transcript_82685/g.267699  ORF Transcript_82685/g.267699 Transcript_82685/m.267699 type:complete len:203 (-) Transcript_82685:1090-1698(-)